MSSASASASPFCTLVKDVLQLIMQQLDSHSLLALARVSRVTFAAAQSDTAWRGRRLSVSADAAATCVHGSLVRFADVSLVWREDGWQTKTAEQVLAVIAPLIRLRALRFQVRMKPSEWQWLLTVPQTAKLCVVILHADVLSFRAYELSMLAERLPLVHTLGLTITGASSPGFLSPLSQIKSLTDLRLCMDDAGQKAEHIGSCAALRKFRWRQQRTREHARILANAQLQSNLVELTLERCHADEPKSWLTVFSRLLTLRVLRLHDVFCIDLCLVELSDNSSAVPQLERLEIGVAAAPSTFLHARPYDQKVVVPTMGALWRLLTLRPQLRLVLFLQPLSAFLADAGSVETRLVTSSWQATDANYAAISSKHADRVSVLARGMLDE